MAYYLASALEAELTCIPQIINKYAGKYYNNTASNGASWLFVMWYLLHLGFASFMKGLLRKMMYKSYINNRVNQALWYLGFYVVVFVYCTATLFKSDFLNLCKLTLSVNVGSLSGNHLLGFMLIITFYCHSALWEFLHDKNYSAAINYLLLSIVMIYAYFMRFTGVAFTLTILISVIRVVTELCRIIQLLNNYNSHETMLATKAFLGLAVAISTAIYCIVLPVNLFPLTVKFVNEPKSEVGGILFCLILWLLAEVVCSPIFRAIKHWIYHDSIIVEDNVRCARSMVECSLFLPRDDELHVIKLYRQEMKERHEKMLSMRKPKGRGMLIQTLKCMVAIKRKINERRVSESSDSDESERSDTDVVESGDIDDSTESGSEDDADDYNMANTLEGEDNKEQVVNGKLQFRVSESKDSKEAPN